MIGMGIVVFAIGFVIASVVSVVCYAEFVDDNRAFNSGISNCVLSLGAVCLFLLVLAVGFSLSYWFWNAGIEQSPRGEVQIVVGQEDNRVKQIRSRTQWSAKFDLGSVSKNVFKTGEDKLDISCTDNKDDDAVPVICVKWSASISTKNQAQELSDSIIDLNYSDFAKDAVEDHIKDIAEESYLECENPDTAIKTSDCMLIYSSEKIDLPHINIVDVIKT